MGKERRTVCSGGLIVVVEAAVWLKLGLSPSWVEEVVDELLHCGDVWVRMANDRESYQGIVVADHPTRPISD